MDHNAQRDRNVLTIFLPILAVAILLCAGGCCYMEKKRKRRLKERGAPEPDINDNDSVITSASSKYRPYLLPNTTTGRTYRTSSYAGSRRSSNAYDLESQYGDPPPYSGWQRSLYDKNNRSKSMVDVTSDSQLPMRRSRSFSVGSGELCRSRGNTSPTASEWSVRTAPQMRGNFDDHRSFGRPSSVASLPVSSSNRMLRRSASQPNLSKTGTYPQGILKRNGSFLDDILVDDRNQMLRTNSRGFNNPLSDYHQQNPSRPPSRSQTNYEPYHHPGSISYQGQYNQAYEDPIYSISQAPEIYRNDWRAAYPSSYDPYAANYWNDGRSGYVYGAY